MVGHNTQLIIGIVGIAIVLIVGFALGLPQYFCGVQYDNLQTKKTEFENARTEFERKYFQDPLELALNPAGFAIDVLRESYRIQDMLDRYNEEVDKYNSECA